MLKQADINIENDTLVLTGALDYSNVMNLYYKSLAYCNNSNKLSFDFANLTGNSAGIALIIEWIKFAKHHQKTIQFKNISADLLSIAKVAGLAHLIGEAC